ncbi:MAG: transcription antitermination factor NusB [Bdellovibrionales bacterium]|nr:transcription antitermination factor NusB [Bdellovibrionales bacterium]
MENSRRQSRELALQVLFQQEFSANLSDKEALEVFRNNFEFSQDIWNYTEILLKGVQNHQNEIDSLLQQAVSHWSLNRLALVDKKLMRIAIFELKFYGTEVPPKVAINEALEMAKKYSSRESASFINGVLDQIHKAL